MAKGERDRGSARQRRDATQPGRRKTKARHVMEGGRQEGTAVSEGKEKRKKKRTGARLAFVSGRRAQWRA